MSAAVVTNDGRDHGEYVIKFGQHVGESLADVYATDRRYLTWVLRTDKGDEPGQDIRVLATVVRAYFKQRKHS